MCPPTEPRLTFTKADRVLKRRQFVELADRAVRPEVKIQAGAFLVIGRANGLQRHRLGVTVTKKIGPAVVRNRLKRQTREFFRQNRHQWLGGLDLLFIARQPAGTLPRPRIREDLARAGRQLAAYRPAAARREPPETGAAAPVPAGPPVETPRFAGEDRAFEGRPLFVSGPAAAWRALGHGLGRLALGGIFVYQRFISPCLPPACRFWPTCSNYAASAVRVHGVWRGSWLTIRRLLKCHPFHPGGYDPVPPAKIRKPDFF